MSLIVQIREITGQAAKATLPVVVDAVTAFARLCGARKALLTRDLVSPFTVKVQDDWGDTGEAGIMVEHVDLPGTVWCLYCDPGDCDDEGETLPGPAEWVVEVMAAGDFDRNYYHVDESGIVWKRGSDGAIREAYRGEGTNQTDAVRALLREIAIFLANHPFS